MSGERKLHWERVYEGKEPTEVSWYQPVPEKSLELIHSAARSTSDSIIDVGGGASSLVDRLLDVGYEDVSVLDISGKALQQSVARLGDLAARVRWIEADITDFNPSRSYAVWHDRAVFHFLTEETDRQRYIAAMKAALRAEGHFLLATFGPEGPLRCSGLDIRRYSVEMLRQLLGDDFVLQSEEIDEHRTPAGATQQFLYSWWQARA